VDKHKSHPKMLGQPIHTKRDQHLVPIDHVGRVSHEPWWSRFKEIDRAAAQWLGGHLEFLCQLGYQSQLVRYCYLFCNLSEPVSVSKHPWFFQLLQVWPRLNGGHPKGLDPVSSLTEMSDGGLHVVASVLCIIGWQGVKAIKPMVGKMTVGSKY